MTGADPLADALLLVGGAVALALTVGGALWLAVMPPPAGRVVEEMERRRVWRR